MGNIIKVGMADLNVCKAPDGLTTLGLGSCIGLTLYDPVTKIGGMVHYMLPDSTKVSNNSNKAKFADTGIEELLKKDIEPEVPIDSNPTGPIDLIDDLDTANTLVSDSSTKSRSVDLLDEEPLKENITVKDEKPEINDIYGFINTPEGMETVVRLYNPEKSEKAKRNVAKV